MGILLVETVIARYLTGIAPGHQFDPSVSKALTLYLNAHIAWLNLAD